MIARLLYRRLARGSRAPNAAAGGCRRPQCTRRGRCGLRSGWERAAVRGVRTPRWRSSCPSSRYRSNHPLSPLSSGCRPPERAHRRAVRCIERHDPSDVRVVNEALPRSPVPDRYLQCPADHISTQMLGHSPAHDAATGDVQYHGQSETPLIPSRHIRAICDPEGVGGVRDNRALNQVGSRLSSWIAPRPRESASALPEDVPDQTGLPPQPRNTLTSAIRPPARHFRVDPWHARGATACLVHHVDLRGKLVVGLRLRHAQEPRETPPNTCMAQPDDGMVGLLALDELVGSHRIATVSCDSGEEGRRFFRISRSSCRMRFSWRNRRTSSCSSLVSPSLRFLYPDPPI